MDAIIKIGLLLMLSDLSSGSKKIHPTTEDKSLKCISTEPAPEELFEVQHWDEVGYIRDTCLELGRFLHQILEFVHPTDECAKLANTRTSTCLWANVDCQKLMRKITGSKLERKIIQNTKCMCKKWKRKSGSDRKTKKVMNVALDMFKDFNLTVSRKYKLEGFQDLHSEITNAVDIAAYRLSKSLPREPLTELIAQINKLKATFGTGIDFKAIRDAEKKQEELDKKQEELDFKEFQDANKKQEEMLQQARHKAIEKQIKKHEEGNTSFKETEAARKEKLNKVDANRTEYVVKLAAEADANRVNGVENVEAVKAV